MVSKAALFANLPGVNGRLAFVLDAFRLKERARSGWELRGIDDGESVADHSWGTALLCSMFASEAGLDAARTVEIALAHDLAEAEIGDVPSLANVADRPMTPAEKAQRESAAMARLEAVWPGEASAKVKARWQEYEDRASGEARFVRDMNLIDMCLMALHYERGRIDMAPIRHAPGALDEFFESAWERIDSAFARSLLEEIEGAYREAQRMRQASITGA